MELGKDIYAKKAIENVETLNKQLRYYIQRTHELEIENKILNEMYENSVNERLKNENNV